MTKRMKRFHATPMIFLGLIFFFTTVLFGFAQEKFRKSPPLPFPLADFDFPKIKTSVLSSGLQISVVKRSQQSFIDMHLIVMTGESLSPDDLPGLASFTSNMLFKGGMGLSASQVEEQIDYIGGDFSVKVFPDYSLFTITYLKEYLNDAVQLLSNLLIQPDFSKNEINNVKRDMYYKIVRNTNPELLGKKLLFQIIFENHPYKKYIFNSSVIKDLNRKDLVTFFDKFYRPNNSKLLFIGDIDLPTAVRITNQNLNQWEKRDLETYHFNPPTPKTKPKICFSDVAGAEQATIFVGNVLPRSDLHDHFSYLVFNQILGGSHVSRLFMNLRETRGYAYWAYSHLEHFQDCSVFYVKAKVKPEYLVPSVSEILREMRSLSQNQIPNHEIEQAKSYLIGHFPIQISGHNEFSLKVSEMLALDKQGIYGENYFENIMYVNSRTVFESLRKVSFLNPVVVIVGDKDLVLEHITALDEVEIFDQEGVFQYKLKNKRENNSLL
ncbi:MAG: peptidase M16 [Candidatus Aminicenantes bacterium]|nr:peptidase M16 [Candidatus Aminicenantes bacterium]